MREWAINGFGSVTPREQAELDDLPSDADGVVTLSTGRSVMVWPVKKDDEFGEIMTAFTSSPRILGKDDITA